MSRVRALAAALAAGAIVSVGLATPAVATPDRDPLAHLTANQIAARAEADLVAATSVHVFSSVSVKGKIRTVINVTITRKACAGSFGLALYGSEQFIQVGKLEWVLLTKPLLAKAGYSKAQIARYAGKWAEASTSSAPLGYISCTSASLKSGLPSAGWTKGGVANVAGHRAVELSNRKKRITAWVSDSSRPEFLKAGSGGAWTTLSRYNARVRISPPPARDVVSLPPPPGL